MLDCKLYEELMEAGETEAFANIDTCVLLTGNQNKGLLHPGPGEDVSDDKKIQIQLAGGRGAPCGSVVHSCTRHAASARCGGFAAQSAGHSLAELRQKSRLLVADGPAVHARLRCIMRGPVATLAAGASRLARCSHAAEEPCLLLRGGAWHAGDPAVQHPGVLHRAALRAEAGLPPAGTGHQPGHRAARDPHQARLSARPLSLPLPGSSLPRRCAPPLAFHSFLFNYLVLLNKNAIIFRSPLSLTCELCRNSPERLVTAMVASYPNLPRLPQASGSLEKFLKGA